MSTICVICVFFGIFFCAAYVTFYWQKSLLDIILFQLHIFSVPLTITMRVLPVTIAFPLMQFLRQGQSGILETKVGHFFSQSPDRFHVFTNWFYRPRCPYVPEKLLCPSKPWRVPNCRCTESVNKTVLYRASISILDLPCDRPDALILVHRKDLFFTMERCTSSGLYVSVPPSWRWRPWGLLRCLADCQSFSKARFAR